MEINKKVIKHLKISFGTETDVKLNLLKSNIKITKKLKLIDFYTNLNIKRSFLSFII